MEKELYYSTIDMVNQSATMRLYGDIGSDVIGAAFVNELVYITGLGIKNIDVRINSGGGSVVEAFTIFSTITTSKSTITTYCDGIAASSAGWIFLAGNRAVMADYSLLMVHNPSSSDVSKKGIERLDFMRNSIITILAARTGTSAKEIGAMMDEETWLDAVSAKDMGFATDVEVTTLLIELQPEEQTVNAMYAICNSAINKNNMIMTEDKVEEVTDVENEMVEETTDEVVNEVTDEVAVEEVTNEAVEDITEPVEAVIKETKVADGVTDEVTNKLDIMNYVNRIAELEAELTQLKEVESFRIANEKEKAGVELVSNAISVGKIKAEAKAEWVAMAVNNYTLAKTTLDALVVNKAGIDIKNLLNKENTEKPKMSLREMEVKDPKQVENIYYNNRATYNQMYLEQYGTMPR